MRRKRYKIKSKSGNIDKSLFLLTLGLTVLGLIVVADASAPQALNAFDDKFFFVKQQLVWALFGIILMIVTTKIHYSIWSKFSIYIFGASIFALILVVIPGIGTKVLGARRWLALGPLSFQPSEFAKLAIALYFAKLTQSKKDLIAYLVPLGLVGVLIMLQPDLGTAIALSTIALSQIFVSGVNLKQFGLILLSGGIASSALVLLSDYRRDRLMTFIQVTSDPLGKGYHIRQILYALGMGGFTGVGLGKSRQKYLFLPESASDSIFAVIAEETGFLGAIVIIALLCTFIYKALSIAVRAPDDFSKSLSLGLTVWIGGQALLNIAAMVALVPLTGVPLPFFSYGGSALVMILFATGILLNISKYSDEK